jgi:hypothetical protein
VCEWSRSSPSSPSSREEGRFVPLDKDGALEDPCFVRPIAVRALLDMASARSEVARALERRGEPEIIAMKQRAEQAGIREGQRRALRRVLARRFGAVTETFDARIEEASSDNLDVWLDKALSASTIDEIF